MTLKLNLTEHIVCANAEYYARKKDGLVVDICRDWLAMHDYLKDFVLEASQIETDIAPIRELKRKIEQFLLAKDDAPTKGN